MPQILKFIKFAWSPNFCSKGPNFALKLEYLFGRADQTSSSRPFKNNFLSRSKEIRLTIYQNIQPSTLFSWRKNEEFYNCFLQYFERAELDLRWKFHLKHKWIRTLRKPSSTAFGLRFRAKPRNRTHLRNFSVLSFGMLLFFLNYFYRNYIIKKSSKHNLIDRRIL